MRNNILSAREAARTYNIPKTTLLDKLRLRTALKTPLGASPVLTHAEEEELAKWALKMASIGYGQTRNQLKLKVKAILDADGRPNPFKDNMPGHDWFTRFLSRHPHISERMGEALGKERALVTVEKLKGWFGECKAYVETIDADLLKDPKRIFNADESGFPLCARSERVLEQGMYTKCHLLARVR